MRRTELQRQGARRSNSSRAFVAEAHPTSHGLVARGAVGPGLGAIAGARMLLPELKRAVVSRSVEPAARLALTEARFQERDFLPSRKHMRLTGFERAAVLRPAEPAARLALAEARFGERDFLPSRERACS